MKLRLPRRLTFSYYFVSRKAYDSLNASNIELTHDVSWLRARLREAKEDNAQLREQFKDFLAPRGRY